MGQAKNRGTKEERVAQAVQRNAIQKLEDERVKREKIQLAAQRREKNAEPDTFNPRRGHSKALMMMALSAAMVGSPLSIYDSKN